MNKKVALLLIALLAAVYATAEFPAAKAEGRTIIVPDDYGTISLAVASAHGGDVIYIRQGTYDGPTNQTILVNKPLTIIGENKQNTTINLYPAYNITWILTACFESAEDAIALAADNCILQNLTLVTHHSGAISAVGNSIQILGNNIEGDLIVNGSNCRVEDNVCRNLRFAGYSSSFLRNTPEYISIQGSFNRAEDNVCGGLSVGNGTYNLILSNQIVSTSRGYAGLSLTGSQSNFIYKNIVKGFGYGLDFWNSSSNIIVANVITDCGTGSFAFGGCFSNQIYLNSLRNINWYNPYYYDFYSDPWIRDYNKDMTVSSNFWDNGSIGNYWGNYNGTDLNGDGVGDSPYNLTVIVHYFEGGENQTTAGVDSFPLVKEVDIKSVNVELPEWADTVGSMGSTQQPQPQLQPPNSSQQPTAPTSTVNLEALVAQDQPNPTGVIAILTGAAVAAVLAGAGAVVLLKKRSRSPRIT